MSYTITLEPNNYTAAYSAVPIQVYSTDYNQYNNYRYIVNLCWDVIENVSGSTAVAYTDSDEVYTKFTLPTTHNFEVGDKVLCYFPSASTMTDYYDVFRVISPTEIVITLEPSITLSPYTFTIAKVIKYKIDPSPSGYGNIELSNSLKDFVSENLSANTTNYGLSYNGLDTMFQYSIFAGEEKRYQTVFKDNFFSSGKVGFNNPSITSLTGIEFEVGDHILVQQDQSIWNYTDNFFSNGKVGFTGTTAHSFLVGQGITVSGQDTYPYYNGQTTILSAGTHYVVVDKDWQGSSPVDGGQIYGVPRPTYNTSGYITQIYIDPTLGLCIVTDIPFATSSIPISGIITYADQKSVETPVITLKTNKRTYNAYVDRKKYTTSYFNKYILKSGTTNNISTILNNTNKYRVEKSTISFLLSHAEGNGSFIDGMAYIFYNNSGDNIGELVIEKPSGSTDFYSPIGLDQIAQSAKVNIVNSFPSYSGHVDSYDVFAVDLTGITYTQHSNMIQFKLNDDCSRYEVYHILWKDQYGSFVSMPFIYVSRETVESAKSSFYKTQGKYGVGTFGYNQWDRGTKDFYEKSKTTYTLNSGWLYEFERELIRDLLQSASVYIQTPENEILPVQIQEKNMEIYKKINEDLYQYTFNATISYNEYRF